MFVYLPKQVEVKYHKTRTQKGHVKTDQLDQHLMQQLLPNELTKWEYGNKMLQISILPVNKWFK